MVPGNTVARIELVLPDSTEFVVHGTVPVPAHTFPRADGKTPFGIRDGSGYIVLAQTEIVSRYPDDDFGADVVEVSARVRRPALAPPGTRFGFDVVCAPHVSGPFMTHESVEDFLRDPLSVVLATRDVFGNRYALDLVGGELTTKQLRLGSAIKEWRAHGNLTPEHQVGGSAATLPHMMGVHAYFRIFDREPVVELDLRIHNGQSGLDPTTNQDDPMGTLYFESVDLWLPDTWRARDADPDTFTGGSETINGHTRYRVITPLADGKLHFFPRQAQTLRRLVLYRPSDEARAMEYVRDENLGFARRGVNLTGQALYSWWNPDTARYFPQRHVLPALDYIAAPVLAADQAQAYDQLSTALRTGLASTFPLVAPAYGWAHPYGVDDGGMQGGAGIVMYDGLRCLETASNDGWRTLAMLHRMYTDRQPVALFDKDGEPTDYLEWTIQGQSGTWLPVWCFLTPILFAADPFGFLQAPQFQVDAVHAQHREPPYEAVLSTYHPIDLEHYVRYTSPAKALAWIGNDSMAKDSLLLSAELFRMSYNELPNTDYHHFISTGMGSDINYVNAYPGIGLTFGRLEGWGIDSVCAAYSLGDLRWRVRVKPWFDRIVDLLHRGQSQCSGIIEALIYEQLLGGQYRARQSIEVAIIENMLVSMRESVLRNVDPVRQATLDGVLARSVGAMVTYPSWSDAYHAPWSKLAVGDNDFTHPPFCGYLPPNGTDSGGDTYQCWSSFAYGYELASNPVFLQRAAEMAGGTLYPALQAQGLNNLENRAALIAVLQHLH